MKTTITRRLRRAAAVAALATATAAVPALAADAADAPLAGRVPSGAIVYAGWAGSDAAGAAMEGTRTGALLEQTSLPELVEDYIPRAAAALARQNGDRNAEALTRNITELAQSAWQYPTVLAFGGVDWNSEINNGEPMPKIMIVCNAGDAAPQLRAKVNELFRLIGKPELAFVVSEQQGHVYLAIGYGQMDMARLTEDGAAGALANGRFAEVATPTFESLDGAPLVVGYVDVPAAVALMQEGMEREEGEQAVAEFRDVFNALGLDGLGRLVLASGFVGENYETVGMLELSPERRGLTRLLAPSGAGLDAGALAAIPGDATLAAAGRLELDQLVDTVRTLVGQFNPDEAQQFEEGLGFLGMLVGTDLERNFFSQFGPTWAAFTSPQIGGDISSGVVVNVPKDRDLLRRGLASMSINLSSIGTQQLSENTDGVVRVPGRSVEMNGARLHVLNAPLVAPTWTVDDERLFLGFYPQHVAAARMVGGGFEESDAWASVQELAGGNEIAGFTYANLPETASGAYGGVLALMQLATGAADTFGGTIGLEPPTVVLPPLPTVMEQLTPSVSVSWIDDDGIHFRGREPFPLSGLLVSNGSGLGGFIQALPGVLGTTMPAMGQAREAATRIESASNLRQIGQMMRMHAIDDIRGAKYPDDLSDLYLTGDLSPEVFVSPRTGTMLTDYSTMTREQQAEWVAANSNYVYLGGGLTDSTGSQTMIAFESPFATNFDEGVNVLFGDGSVRFIDLFELEQLWEEHMAMRQEKQVPMDDTVRRNARYAITANMEG